MIRSLVAPVRDGDLIGLARADLQAGESLESSGKLETAIVVLSGVVDVEADGRGQRCGGGSPPRADA